MTRDSLDLLLITGGLHPFHETTPIVAAALRAAGHAVTVTVRAGELTGPGLAAYDAMILNSVRGKGDMRYEVSAEERDNDFSPEQRAAFQSFVAEGGGLVSLHVSPTSCPGWPEMMRITGGGWVWGVSTHPPYGPFQVHIADPAHPITAGVADFESVDELYCRQEIAPDAHVFLDAMHDGVVWPLGWTISYGKGRVANISLGHNGASFAGVSVQRLIVNAVSHVARIVPAP